MTYVVPVPVTATPRITPERRRALRVKIRSLAAEAKIIRHEEARARADMTAFAGKPEAVAAMASAFASLRSHRVNDVRRESRYAQLTLAFLRGRSLASTEPPKKDGTRREIELDKLARQCARFESTKGSWCSVTQARIRTEVEAWIAGPANSE